jgi:hypothetical protein
MQIMRCTTLCVMEVLGSALFASTHCVLQTKVYHMCHFVIGVCYTMLMTRLGNLNIYHDCC